MCLSHRRLVLHSLPISARPPIAGLIPALSQPSAPAGVAVAFISWYQGPSCSWSSLALAPTPACFLGFLLHRFIPDAAAFGWCPTGAVSRGFHSFLLLPLGPLDSVSQKSRQGLASRPAAPASRASVWLEGALGHPLYQPVTTSPIGPPSPPWYNTRHHLVSLRNRMAAHGTI